MEAQVLKISTNHDGGKGEGELQDVTSLPKKTLDTSLVILVTNGTNFSYILVYINFPIFYSLVINIYENYW